MQGIDQLLFSGGTVSQQPSFACPLSGLYHEKCFTSCYRVWTRSTISPWCGSLVAREHHQSAIVMLFGLCLWLAGLIINPKLPPTASGVDVVHKIYSPLQTALVWLNYREMQRVSVPCSKHRAGKLPAFFISPVSFKVYSSANRMENVQRSHTLPHGFFNYILFIVIISTSKCSSL